MFCEQGKDSVSTWHNTATQVLPSSWRCSCRQPMSGSHHSASHCISALPSGKPLISWSYSDRSWVTETHMAWILTCLRTQLGRHTFKRYHHQRIMSIYISKWSQRACSLGEELTAQAWRPEFEPSTSWLLHWGLSQVEAGWSQRLPSRSL